MSDSEEWIDVTNAATAADDGLSAYNAFVTDASATSPVFRAGDLCYVLRYPGGAFVTEAKTVARKPAGCNACTSRAGLYVRDLGPSGPVFFNAKNASLEQALDPCDAEAVTRLRALARTTCAQAGKPELVVVTSSTYAAAQDGCRPCGTPFYHWTVRPAEVSTPEAAARFEQLKLYYGQMDTRLAKLTVPEAVASVKIMMEEQQSLLRPNHYAACLRWVSELQRLAAEARSSSSFEAMNEPDRARLRILACMSGRADGSTHLDFHQSDNIVDFLTMPSRDALRAEMDRRSDPAFYMVSQLNRRLADAGVTSQHLIGLSWDGAFSDDLDLHVITPGRKEVCYNNKSADGCKLDFDANVNGGEANPCENVSVRPGTFKVRVNNYTRRTHGKPIPFQVICRQAGMEDVVYSGTWGVNRPKGAMIDVCTHTFTPVTDAPIGMSAKSAARTTALSGEWDARIGSPTATVATLAQLEGAVGVNVAMCGKGGGARVAKTAAEVGDAFMDMALTAKRDNVPRAKKAFLSESCAAQPKTVRELVAHVKAHPATRVAVLPRDHAPGYLVSIGTKTAGVRKTELPSPCHFDDKHAHPRRPVVGRVGNARLDASWTSRASPNGFVRVEALVEGVGDGCAFLVLEGARLPTGGDADAAFPLASGFYPTDLAADLHAHRERYTYYHTQLKPSMPPRGAAAPLVGTFLVGANAVIYIDGVKTTLAC